jgi:uncharacterized membrane protein
MNWLATAGQAWVQPSSGEMVIAMLQSEGDKMKELSLERYPFVIILPPDLPVEAIVILRDRVLISMAALSHQYMNSGRARGPPESMRNSREAGPRFKSCKDRSDFAMFLLSPDRTELHAVIVHIPIVLLLVPPFFVIVSIGLPAAKRRPLLWSALTLMVFGTVTIFVAVTTGEAAMKTVDSAPALKVVLAEHQSLAETTLELFIMLTLGLALLMFAPRLLGRALESRINTALLAIFLLLYTTGALLLVHTALQGKHLARELDVKAATYQLFGRESAW